MNIWKSTFHLIIIYSVLFTGFFLFNKILQIGLPFSNSIILLSFAFLISLITLWMFSRGIIKEGQKRFITIMSALGVKLLLYLILLLVYYLLSKIQGVNFIVTFFIIYLSFTYYVLRVLIKAMKFKQTKE